MRNHLSEIRDTLDMLFKDGDTIIVSRLFTDREGMAKDAFNSLEQAAAFAEAQDQDTNIAGIYINVQRLKPGSTSDKRPDVAAYMHFMVDFDRRNKKVDGVRVNANENERNELFAAMKEANAWISRVLEARPLVADTGNGFHLVWDIKPVPCTVENEKTIKECLLAIKQKFGKGNVEIDTSVAEPNQLTRLYGTQNRKDPETEDRPHRKSKVLAKARGVVSPSHFDLLACEYSPPKGEGQAKKTGKRGAPRVDPEWLEDYGVEHLCEWGEPFTPLARRYEKDGETHFVLGNCFMSTEDGLHTHSGDKKKTEFILGYSLGLSCFSDDCNRKYRMGLVIRRLNELKGENYPHRIFLEDGNDSGFEVEEVRDVDAIIEAIDIPARGTANGNEQASETPISPGVSEERPPVPELVSAMDAGVDWMTKLFAVVFSDPQHAYNDFPIWRGRLEWIVEQKAWGKNQIPMLKALLAFERRTHRLPSRDELIQETLTDIELVGMLSNIGGIEEDISLDFAVGKLLDRAEWLDERRTAGKYVKLLEKPDADIFKARKHVKDRWSNSISTDVPLSEGTVQDNAYAIYQRFEDMTNGKEDNNPLAFYTPFTNINESIISADERCFAVIAPPSNFKTTVLLTNAYWLARQGKPTLIVTGEHDVLRLEERIALLDGYYEAEFALPSYKDWRDKKATPDDLMSLRGVIEKMHRLISIPAPLVVKHLQDFDYDFGKIVSFMEETHKKYQWRALVIDPFEDLTSNALPDKVWGVGDQICKKMLKLKTGYHNGEGLIVMTSFQLKKEFGAKISTLRRDPEAQIWDYEALLVPGNIETFGSAAKKFDMLWGVADVSMNATKGIITSARTRHSKPFETVEFDIDARSHMVVESKQSRGFQTDSMANVMDEYPNSYDQGL
jgi:hypothetical protein